MQFSSDLKEMAMWTDEERNRPMGAWGEEDIQSHLEGCVHKELQCGSTPFLSNRNETV